MTRAWCDNFTPSHTGIIIQAQLCIIRILETPGNRGSGEKQQHCSALKSLDNSDTKYL